MVYPLFPENKNHSWKIFESIATRYDLINHLLSFSLDFYWRRKMNSWIGSQTQQRMLDLATGTAAVPISLKNSRNIEGGIGIDLADNMLAIGREKLAIRKLEKKFILQKGDAVNIPFPDRSFNLVTMAFGIRNVNNISRVLTEAYRVLKSPGRLIILEFSLPRLKLLRFLYLIYLRYILPLIGGLLSGNYPAYRYLNATIETFPSGSNFCALFKKAGFDVVKNIALSGGIASLYIGEKK